MNGEQSTVDRFDRVVVLGHNRVVIVGDLEGLARGLVYASRKGGAYYH
jgi:hypothetical protein